MTLAETLSKLAQRRLSLCMTWAELAKASGVAEDTIRVWLDPKHRSGRPRVPNAANLWAVAETLGYDLIFIARPPPIANDNPVWLNARFVHESRSSP